ncbi:MAG: hypothetical protein MPF33_08950 [Candidatus Aramenus sp.]|jgi:hypothetical protein|nr:hypothetical protein [Candidatus Aramenus sp.]
MDKLQLEEKKGRVMEELRKRNWRASFSKLKKKIKDLTLDDLNAMANDKVVELKKHGSCYTVVLVARRRGEQGGAIKVSFTFNPFRDASSRG